MSHFNLKTTCPICYGTGVSYFNIGSFWRERHCTCGARRYWSMYRVKHKQAILEHNNHVAWVDEGMLDDLHLLLDNGFHPEFSCAGDPEVSVRYVSLENPGERREEVWDLLPWVRSDWDLGLTDSVSYYEEVL